MYINTQAAALGDELPKVVIIQKRRCKHASKYGQISHTYWEDKSEFAVDLGVSFGKIFEFYLPCKWKELGYNVIPTFTSKGDMVENDISLLQNLD